MEPSNEKALEMIEIYKRAQQIAFMHYGLSKGEIRVARQILNGAMISEAAEALFITESGVKFHLTNIYRKVGVKSKAEFRRKIKMIIADLILGKIPV